MNQETKKGYAITQKAKLPARNATPAKKHQNQKPLDSKQTHSTMLNLAMARKQIAPIKRSETYSPEARHAELPAPRHRYPKRNQLSRLLSSWTPPAINYVEKPFYETEICRKVKSLYNAGILDCEGRRRAGTSKAIARSERREAQQRNNRNKSNPSLCVAFGVLLRFEQSLHG